MGGVYQGLGAKPHELQPVGEKKTDGIGPTALQIHLHSKLQLQKLAYVRMHRSGKLMHQNAPFRE